MTDDAIPTTPEDDGGVKPFAAFLQEQRNGALHAEMSEALQQVVAAVVAHDKAGSLTLTISVKPAGNGMNVVISDEVKAKAPEAARPIALWYFDDLGNVSRADPRQPELPLREVTPPKSKPIREVGA